MVFIVPPLFCALRRLFVSFATLANGERNTRVREPTFNFTRESATQMHRTAKKSCGMCAHANNTVSRHAATHARTYPTQSVQPARWKPLSSPAPVEPAANGRRIGCFRGA